MSIHHYRFITHWRVEGTQDEVYQLIDDSAAFVRWWPAVWLKAEMIKPGDEQGIGKVMRYLTKGWLPYLLTWSAEAMYKERPHRLELRATGDFDGRGVWTFKQDGASVDIQYVWEIEAKKPLLRYLAFLLKPIFSANHNWAMARGLDSLRLELARRHAQSDEIRAQVPEPPQPTFLSTKRRQKYGLPTHTRSQA